MSLVLTAPFSMPPETTLRQVVGGKVLQSVISDREALAAEITEILEQVADKWGVAVESVLLKDIVSAQQAVPPAIPWRANPAFGPPCSPSQPNSSNSSRRQRRRSVSENPRSSPPRPKLTLPSSCVRLPM